MSVPGPISRKPADAPDRRIRDGSRCSLDHDAAAARVAGRSLAFLRAALRHLEVHPPRACDVWAEWRRAMVNPRLWNHTYWTLYATLTGFFWATLIGVTLGVLIARLRWLELTLNPFIIATQVIPKVALVPLFVVWFGFGVTSKVIVAAVLAFFPILTNTVLGVKSIEEGHKDVMMSLNATRWQVFRGWSCHPPCPTS